MTFALFANNLTSTSLVIATWWLAHQYARIYPAGRVIAAFLALLGFATLYTMFSRNFDAPIVWPIIAQKAILTLVLVMIAIPGKKRRGP